MAASGNLALQRGHTLLELVAATALLTITLVPALRIMRDTLSNSRKTETLGILTTLCVDKIEQYQALTGSDWQETTASGSFSSLGYPEYRYLVVRSDELAGGGIPNRLMAITATTFEDEDSSTTLDAGEPYVRYSTKLARLGSYRNEAGN
jgi:type II secretory pathway pseudopilin PulG